MKHKSYWKECLRDLSHVKGRFIAMVAIVALGAGFFGGIKATSIDMKLTADQYYKHNALMDFRVVSTLGVTDKDAAAIREIEGVRDVFPAYRADAIISKGDSPDGEIGSDSIVRLHSLPTGESVVNKTVLTAGRMPENSNEAVLLGGRNSSTQYTIGDSLVVDLQQDPDIADSLNSTSFEIVGIVNSPLYMSLEQTSTSKGSGSISCFAFLPEAAFEQDAYSELYLTMEIPSTISSFSTDYSLAADELQDMLKEIGLERCEVRRSKVVEEATGKLNDAKTEYAEKKAEAEQKLADARIELDDAQQKIADGEKELEDGHKTLSDGEKELAEKQADYDKTILDARQKLDDVRVELNQRQNEIEEGKVTLVEKEEELESGRRSLDSASSTLSKKETEYDAAKALLDQSDAAYQAGVLQYDQQEAGAAVAIKGMEDAISRLDPTAPGYDAAVAGYRAQISAIHAALVDARAQLDNAKSQLDAGRAQLSDGRAQLDSGHRQLASGYDEAREGAAAIRKAKQDLIDGQEAIDEGRLTLADKEREFETEKADAEQQLADARQKIADGKVDIIQGEKELADSKIKLADAEIEYTKAKTEADDKLTDANEKILDAEEAIADIDKPDWYVFDRDASPGYAGFSQDADRVDAIAMVFPVFFFLVAALVCLTTMTRMVEEQRTQIGVMKALGYSKAIIIGKYLSYAAATSLIGSFLGLAIGFQVFPRVIWAAYGIMYTTPPILTPWNMQYGLIATIVFLICTISSTFAASYGELMSVPANLIRPKPPKNGKRIFLENIPFLWKHLSFTKKLTARNILRYKKRFFMTVIGIAGCTALMLAGFGLKDSINGIVKNQFGNLFHYDLQVAFSHEIVDGKETVRQQQALNSLQTDERITQSVLVRQESTTARSGKSTKSLTPYIFVPQDTTLIREFITFQDRRSKKPVAFPEEGALITEKLSYELNLSVGDLLILEDGDGKQVEIPVAGICENYVYHYVYLSSAQYEKLFQKTCSYQGMIAAMSDSGKAFESALSSDLLTNDEIVTVSYTTGIIDTFTEVFDRLDLVVLVLILSASLLAFVVLYNLTNININERVREIATIKVLGFYDGEVDRYIYRENIVLTLLGVLTGFVLGIFLHQYVMRVAEVNIVMFGREILPPSFLWAGLLTVAFSLAVNFVMHFHLKKISMVESLKSIE